MLTSSRGDRHQDQVSRQDRLVFAVLELFSDQSQNLSDLTGQAAPDGDVGVIRSVNAAENCWIQTETSFPSPSWCCSLTS